MKVSAIRIALLATVISLLGIPHAQRVRADKPDWQKHIDWCVGNSDAGGSVDCPGEYARLEGAHCNENGQHCGKVAACVAVGGRSCLMDHAIENAKADRYGSAFDMTMACQCHSGGAQQALADAGAQAVGNYLKNSY